MMKCNEARNLVLAYLDSELDAKTSQEIQLHLQSCTECAQLFEREERFNERLFQVMRTSQVTPELWERVESRLRPQHGMAWWFVRWKLATLGSFAALVLAVLVAVFIQFNSGSSSLDLASAVAPDHAKYAAGQLQPQFAAQPPTAALAKEQGRLDAAAFLKLPVRPGFRAEGKRVCHLSGVPVAWIMGRDGDLPVSVVVLRRSELDHFPQLRQRLEAGHPVVCARTGRFEFAARMVGAHVVCAMAAMPRERLESLVKTVPGTSNAG